MTKTFTRYLETGSIHSNAKESSRISKLWVFCLTSWFPRASDKCCLIYRDKVSGKTSALAVGDLDDPPVFFPWVFGHSEAHTWACYSTAKSTGKAIWGLHLDGAVWRCRMKMHPKYGFFSRISWPSCKTPMVHQSILADFQSMNLYPDKIERWRVGCRAIWVGKTNTSRSKLKKIFLLTCHLCACFLWDHLFSCLYTHLTLKIWPEDLKPLFVPLETQTHLVIIARIKACFRRCVLLKLKVLHFSMSQHKVFSMWNWLNPLYQLSLYLTYLLWKDD